MEPTEADGALIQVTINDDGRVAVWTRNGMPAETLAQILHDVADGFATGAARRVV